MDTLQGRTDPKPARQPAAAALTEARTAEFTSVRPLLFSIAYRMVGSVSDAEDLVQDSYARWLEAPDADVRSSRAYLATIVTRLSINHLKSARVQRESYVGAWLPEPLVTDHAPDPSEPVELAESLSMAFLLMLERLSPIERAVLILHDVFDFDYDEIARVVDKSEANCRQLLSRAKKRLGARETRFEADRTQAERLVQRFSEAVTAGDLDGLLALLAEDITLYGDGGGKVRGAVLRPVTGANAVARLCIGVLQKFVPVERTLRPAQINGHPGFVVYTSGRPFAALTFEIHDGRIHTIYSVANPDKLAGLERSGA